MLSMGSEMGHSQQGNNNAYAQDAEIAWPDWVAADPALIETAARLVAARRGHPALHGDAFLTGAGDPADVAWHRPNGAPMTPDDWNAPDGASLVMLLAVAEGRVAVVLHRGREPLTVHLPDGQWRDALTGTNALEGRTTVAARSVAMFEQIRPSGAIRS